ncbi:MAG: hypothetical protein HY830_23570 [Actinobacteria bacterium]|nr:hypothetical protein [Actinomycetota bacterium]
MAALGGCSAGASAGPDTAAPSVATTAPTTTAPGTAAPSATAPAVPPAATSAAPTTSARPAPAVVSRAGNPDGRAVVPAAARAVTKPKTRWVGTGTKASCTSAAVVRAVAAGGVIGFRCGPDPVTIVLTATAKVRNTSPLVVLDGGGLVTLSGGGKRRILYMNTCDEKQVWTTSHCQDQATPQLVVQNLTFADGNATGQHEEGGGGGAVLVRGGRFRVVSSRFVRNRCDSGGQDLGGAALRVLDQWHGEPVYVVSSTFGGRPGQGGTCSNGGALSSIGVSWTVLNSVLSYNSAVGRGANPARSGTVGGGSGGAIYNDGNTMTLRLEGTVVEHNSAREGGGAVFFVSNDRTGTLRITRSTLRSNPSRGFATAGYPGIFFLGRGAPQVSGSTLR